MKGASREADVTCANDTRGHHYSAADAPLMLAPKRLPSRICSSRLDWNFDNMELSALACEAVNCCVQRLRRETIERVHKKSSSHTTTMREVLEIFRCPITILRFHGFTLCLSELSKSPWPQQRYTRIDGIHFVAVALDVAIRGFPVRILEVTPRRVV